MYLTRRGLQRDDVLRFADSSEYVAEPSFEEGT